MRTALFSERKLTSLGLSRGVLATVNALLFGASEPGAWYDPSDLSTLFQDAAGTTPVTAVEQPVGRMLDKSGRGNHATQSTTTKRPVLSRRVNMLLKTDSPADWVNHGVGFEAGSKAPDGGTLLTAKDAASTFLGSVHTDYPIGSSARPGKIIRTIEVKGGSAAYVYVGAASIADTGVCVRLADGVVELASTASYSVVPTTDGYWRITVSVESASSLNASQLSNYLSWGAARSYYAVDTASRASTTIYVRNPSYIYTGVGDTTSFPYQWVNTATDYDADPAKFPAYLRFDGVDDAMQTGNIDFTGTDKMTVWAGVSRLTSLGIIVELSANGGTNFGTFRLQNFLGSGTAGDSVSYGSSGSNLVLATNSPPINVAAPTVITGLSDISADYTRVRADGIFGTTNSSDQGTGNYGNYPLYIGARAGTSQYFNGRIYSLIVRGAQSSQSQIEATELYVKRKMKLP